MLFRSVEDGQQVLVSIDEGLLGGILQTVLADVVLKLFRQLRAWKGCVPDNLGQQLVRLDRFQERRARRPFCLFWCFSHVLYLLPYAGEGNIKILG